MTKILTDSELDAVLARLPEMEEREAKATKGPWIQDGPGCLPWQVSPSDFEFAGVRISLDPTHGDEEDHLACIPDAVFIAHCRQDLPALIAALRTMVAQRDALRARVIALSALSEPIWDSRNSEEPG